MKCNYKSFSVALTTRCNANCVMCWRRKKWGAGQDMTAATYAALKRFLEDCEPKSLIFISTGEPTLFYGIEDFLMFCAYKHLRVLMYSNAQKAPQGLEKAFSQGLDISFGFSIDGGTNEIVSRIQRGCTLDKMLATIDSILEMPKTQTPLIDINFIANASNIHSLDQLVNKLPNNAIHSIVISPMKYFKIMDDAALKNDVDSYSSMDLNGYYRMVASLCDQKGIKLKPFSPNDGFYDYASVCKDRARMLVIDVNGDILPCVGTEKFRIGNVANMSLEEVNQSLAIQTIDDGLKSGNLAQCCADCSLSLRNRFTEYYE